MDALVKRMRGERQRAFHRNGESIAARARALVAQAEQVEGLLEAAPLELTAVLVAAAGDGRGDAAIINGRIYREGEPILHPASGEATDVRLLDVRAEGVRVRRGEVELLRSLGD